MLNNLTLEGRLGVDPETRYTGNGDPVATFSFASSEKVRGEEITSWVRVVAFGKKAELCASYLKKGQRHVLSGRLRVRKYESDTGGGTSVELLLNDIVFIDRAEENAEQRQQNRQQATPPPADDFDDDIPF